MSRWFGWLLVALAIFQLLKGRANMSGSTPYGQLGGRVHITPGEDGWFFWLLLLFEFALGVFLVAR